MPDIDIEINGKKLTASPDQMIIQVADAAGIYIPRFCYHKHLSIAANCRMCLVEVEKSPKTLPACATPVMPGMKVFTTSQKTIDAQRAVMAFLLINHPLDCPICDQGGECELQDLSMGYGASHSHYDECKRAVADENLGPLIATEMTRCIYCTRCVRFGDEVAGMREMGVMYRGEGAEVSTYIEQAIQSEVSGNIIDLCPVGALTSKPYRFTARAWELDQAPSISPHDALGSNVQVHTRYGKVMRVAARENQAINDTWLSDRDRFSYTGLYHADRLKEPMIRQAGVWKTVDWEEALTFAVHRLQAVIHEDGADQLGALASSSGTLEEFYLLQKIMRGLGSPHIDHRLRDIDTRDQAVQPLFPGLNQSFVSLSESDAVLLVGSNLQKEQPLAALRVRQAALKGAAVLVINPVDYRFNFKVSAKKIVAPQDMVSVLAALANTTNHEFSPLLQNKKKMSIVLGALALHHPEASAIRYWAQKVATRYGGTLSLMTDGANTAGAWLAGAIPHRTAGGQAVLHSGWSAYAMLSHPRKAYVLLNVEPDLDSANAAMATAALSQAKSVMALSVYRSPLLEAQAEVLLPIAPFTETSGTFVNAAGEWQTFQGVATAYYASRPAWKVLRALGSLLSLDGFDYDSSEAVRDDVKEAITRAPVFSTPSRDTDFSVSTVRPPLMRVGEIPIYAIDSLARRAQPLQEAQAIMEGDVTMLRLHPETAKKHHIKNGDRVRVRQASQEMILTALWDERIAEEAVWIAGGLAETAGLGDLFGEIEVSV